MFKTPAERKSDRTDAQHGIRVTFPDGVVHWYPGGSAALAQILLDRNVPSELATHPKTRVEFGRWQRGMFVTLEVVKEGQRDATNTEQRV